jgi:hypothetical protein
MNRDERDDADTPKGGTNEQRPHTGDRGRERTPPAMGGYQEGSVESVGGGPSGTDTDDRTGQSGSAPDVPRAPEREGNRDVFISSEVAKESAEAPGHPERTRG